MTLSPAEHPSAFRSVSSVALPSPSMVSRSRGRCIWPTIVAVVLSLSVLAGTPAQAQAQVILTAQAMATGTAAGTATAQSLTATAAPPRPTATPTPRPPSTSTPTAAPRLSPSATPVPPSPARASATPTAAASPTAAATSFPVGGTLAGRRITIDPGHGAPDPGAVYNGLYESNVNLSVALEVRALLAAAGADVTLTRTTDRALAVAAAGDVVDLDRDLQGRVTISNQASADLFVSLHANVGADPSVRGAITFYGAEDGFASGARRTPRQVGLSVQLASDVERELTVATGAPDRGVRPANFWVLGGTRAPAVLVEMGYLTNPQEAALLGSPAYQRRLAQGVVAGVARYFATEDDAVFVADVTLPDGAQVFPGTALLKTWRLRNTGLTTWGPGYRLGFSSGAQLGGPESVPLPVIVPPGAEVDVSVPLQAPAQDTPGAITGWWQLRAPDGLWFGDRVWVAVRARTVLPTDRAAPIPHPEVRYVDATGHNLGFGFRAFFDAHGGLDRFGYPRTEEIQENGWTVQYFQRARFEYHPELAGTPYEVELGLLGDQLTTARRPFPQTGPFPEAPDHRFFPETGHGVHFAFWRYFRERGDVDSFGHPISEELPENGYAVQYFQRARFEYHPEFAGTPYEVELGLLGDEYLRRQGWLR